MKTKVIEFYRSYHAKHHKAPTMRVCAEALDISPMTVKYHIEMLAREGHVVVENRKVYLARNGKPIKLVQEDKTNKQKSEAGVRGAEALKKLAFEKGVARFTPGMGADENKIKSNIEAIVRKAEEKGTLYRPRPVYVVLVGEKVG